LDYLVVRQTDEHKSWEWMPAAGKAGTNPGLHAHSGMGRIKNSRLIGLLQGTM
jgi:hypothetical protein